MYVKKKKKRQKPHPVHAVSVCRAVTQNRWETGRQRGASSTERWSGFSSGVRLNTRRSSADLCETHAHAHTHADIRLRHSTLRTYPDT